MSPPPPPPFAAAIDPGPTPGAPDPAVLRTYGAARHRAEDEVAALAFDDAGALWAVEEPGVLRAWGPAGEPLCRFFLSDAETLWAFDPRARRLAAGSDGLTVWDLPDAHTAARAAGLEWVTALAFSPDGERLASGHDGGLVRLWRADSLKPVGEFRTDASSVSALAFRSDGRALAAAGEDRSVLVWDVATRRRLASLVSHSDRVAALAWHPTDNVLVSGGWDSSARVWRPPTPDPVMLLNTFEQRVVSVAFSPGGEHLACGDAGGSVTLWSDAPSGRLLHVLGGHTDEAAVLAFGPGGRLLASSGPDGSVQLREALSGRLVSGGRPGGGRPVVALAAGAAGPLLLSNCGGDRLHAWDAGTGSPVEYADISDVETFAVSADGRTLAVGGGDRVVRLHSSAGGATLAELEGQKGRCAALAFAPSGPLLASASADDGTCWLWDVTRREPELLIIEAADAGTVEALAFHPNGRWLACGGVDWMSTGGGDGAACVWDVPERERLATLVGGTQTLAYDPAGQRLVAGATGSRVTLWHALEHRALHRLGGHGKAVLATAVSPDGRVLAGVGDDRVLRLWDVASGERLAARLLESQAVALHFAPDGAGLYAGFSNGTCALFGVAKLLE